MKITTQRTLLWLGNFVLAAALIGLVVVFDKTASNKAAAKMARAELGQFKDDLREIKAGSVENAQPEAFGAKIDRVFSRDFHYMGYVAPPPPPPPVDRVTRAPKPPALADLVEVVFLIAPRRDAVEGSDDFIDDAGKAVLKLRKLSGSQTIFTYGEGEIIGLGEREDRPDREPTDFVKWGGARIVRIEPDRLVARWVDHEEGDPEVVAIVSRDVAAIGADGRLNLGGGSTGGAGPDGAKTAAAADADGPMFTVADQGVRTTATLTKAGWQQLNARGNDIMNGISFEKGKDLNGKDALKISSMPPQLREYGLRDGDVIVRIDSVYTTSKESIARYVKKTYQQKTSYNLQVLRDGKMRILRVNVPRDVKKIPSRARGAGAATRNRINRGR